MKLSVIIPAAGASTRFGSGDKLSADLGGRPLLLRAIEIFSRRQEVVQIIVAGPPDAMDAFKDRFGAGLGFHGITLVAGGREDRWETVRNALEAVEDSATHVAVHDAARPLVSDEMLDRIFMASERLDAVVPVVAVSSTLKEIDPSSPIDVGEGDDELVDGILGDAGRFAVEATPIKATVDRSRYAMAQTPQVFKRELIMRAYASQDLRGVTDDSQVVEGCGVSPHAVQGDPANIKITTVDDLRLAHSLMKSAPPSKPKDPLLG